MLSVSVADFKVDTTYERIYARLRLSVLMIVEQLDDSSSISPCRRSSMSSSSFTYERSLTTLLAVLVCAKISDYSLCVILHWSSAACTPQTKIYTTIKSIRVYLIDLQVSISPIKLYIDTNLFLLFPLGSGLRLPHGLFSITVESIFRIYWSKNLNSNNLHKLLILG